jgi:TolB-like protein/DNA-binding winged helix-turn-helix (wHTH) protein/Tfp pilus assembly protein PilF
MVENSQITHHYSVRFGAFEVDLEAGELRKNGIRIKLQEQPFHLLRVLLEHPQQVITREELQKQLWPEDTFVDFEQGLNRAMAKLRDALGDSSDNPRFIQTLARKGYRFLAPVDNHDVPVLTAVNKPDRITSSTTTASDARGEVRRSRKGPTIVAAAVLLLLVVGGTVWTWNLRSRRLQRASSSPIRSVAILPIANLSGDPSQEYFADAMTDGLITDLARIGIFQVTSRSSVMQYKFVNKPLPQIAHELQVDAIIEGSVSRSANQTRLDIKLVRSPSDRYLWVQTYERDIRDTVSLQNDVAEDITQEIAAKLNPEQKSRLPLDRRIDPQAQDDYFQGRYFWNKRTEEGYNKAIEHFERAIHAEPKYAQAYAGLADSYALLGSWPNQTVSRSIAMPKAKAAAIKALELDESLAEAHTSLAFVEMHYEWNWSAAQKDFQRAIELNPSYATAHQWYGFDLLAMGHVPAALSEIQRARELDPLSLIINTDYCEVLHYAGQIDAAIQQCRKVLEMDPKFTLARHNLGWLYMEKKMYPEALQEFQTCARDGGMWFMADLAAGYATSGKPREAHRALDELIKWSRNGQNLSDQMAGAYLALGKRNEAFTCLETSYKDHSGSLILLRFAPSLYPLHSDPRFADLAKRICLPQ